MKKCNCCKELLVEDMFSVNRATLDGLSNRCKECSNTARTEKRNQKKLLNPKEEISYELITHKQCKGSCNEVLHLSRFNVSKLTKDGREGICRECRSEKRKQNGLIASEKTHKTCSKCKNLLDISLFSKDTSRDDGYSYICKECKSETYQEYIKDPEIKERALERTAVWREENPDKVRKNYQDIRIERIPQIIKYHNSPAGRHTIIKAQAKHREIEYKLTKEFINHHWDANCNYCGDPLDIPRFDRLDSDIGYIIENVVPCCKICNYGKLEMSPEEYIEHCRKVVEFANAK